MYLSPIQWNRSEPVVLPGARGQRSGQLGLCDSKAPLICCDTMNTMMYYDNLWTPMSIFEHLWTSMSIFEHLWQSMIIYEHLWWSSVMTSKKIPRFCLSGSTQWVDKKGKIYTGNQPDFPMKIMGFSCKLSQQNQSIDDNIHRWTID